MKPLRNAPYDVDRITLVNLLQHQHRRAFPEDRVIFNHHCGCDAAQNISNENSVGGQLVITVLRDTNVADSAQRGGVCSNGWLGGWPALLGFCM